MPPRLMSPDDLQAAALGSSRLPSACSESAALEGRERNPLIRTIWNSQVEARQTQTAPNMRSPRRRRRSEARVHDLELRVETSAQQSMFAVDIGPGRFLFQRRSKKPSGRKCNGA